jgi:hypothetical protein
MAVEIGSETWQAFRSPLTAQGAWIDLIVAAPQSELLAEANAIRTNMLLICLAALGIAVPIALTASKLISQSLDKLTAEAREINTLRFDKPFDVRSPVVEVDRLAHAMGLAEPDGDLVGALARFDGRQLAGLPPPTLKPGGNDDHPAMQAALSRANVEVTVTPEQVTRWYPGFEHSQHFAVIALPLKNRQDDLVGVLMLRRIRTSATRRREPA